MCDECELGMSLVDDGMGHHGDVVELRDWLFVGWP